MVSIDRCYTVTTEGTSRLQDSYDDVGDRCWKHLGVKFEMSLLCHQYFKIFPNSKSPTRDVTNNTVAPTRYQTYQKLVQGQPQLAIESCINSELAIYTNKKNKK